MDGTVAITGASRGIGEAVARAFASEGARVAICAREGEAVDAVVEDIEADGGTATGMRADVRDEFDVERFVETASRFGEPGIDVVVANAGVYHGPSGETPIDREPYSAFDDHLRTNARGVFATIRESVPHLAEDGRAIVTTGSVARSSAPGYGSYAVSRAAAEAVAMAFAEDLQQTVGCVDPGRVATRIGGEGHDPDDVAPQYVWAAEADPEVLDGEVLDRRDWREATR
jgi:NAD(P)-dependent dehydrogenase (short-subunit alcohol dehydrogenase family)